MHRVERTHTKHTTTQTHTHTCTHAPRRRGDCERALYIEPNKTIKSPFVRLTGLYGPTTAHKYSSSRIEKTHDFIYLSPRLESKSPSTRTNLNVYSPSTYSAPANYGKFISSLAIEQQRSCIMTSQPAINERKKNFPELIVLC